MAEPVLRCPGCGAPIELGDVECPHCGVNVKSGETFETRMRRAKGKMHHQEVLIGSAMTGLAMALLLCSLGGYLYQRRMEAVIKESPHFFVPAVQRMEEIQDMAAAGQVQEARAAAQQLADRLTRMADAIEPSDVYTQSDHDVFGRRTRAEKRQYDERGAKRLLYNLAAKARFMGKELPDTRSAS